MASKLRITVSYIFDYVIVIGCIVAFTILDNVEPYHQHFALTNISLQYPFAVNERIPPRLAAIICVAGPAGIILVWTLFLDGIFSHHKNPKSRASCLGPHSFGGRLWQLNAGILGLLLSVSTAIVITGALKNTVGKPRPDLISRCQPQPGSADPLVFGLVTSSICTQTDNTILKDGFRSFPSGHSSTAFAGLGYLSLFLAGRLHILDNRGEVWKTLLVLIPVLVASLVAATRIMDARHHGFDVLSGSLLGLVVAWSAYRQYYPPLHETWKKGRAFGIRSWGNEPGTPASDGHRDRYEGDNFEDSQARSRANKLPYNGDIEMQAQRKKGAADHNQRWQPSTLHAQGDRKGWTVLS